MVGHVSNKTNAPYLIAGTLATLALIASGTLAVVPYVGFLSPIAFNIVPPVALSLSILSVLVLVLSYKMISNNKKVELEKNKFAAKEQELAAKTQELEGERGEKEQLEELLREKVGKLTREKPVLESRVEGLNKEVGQLKKQQTETQQKLNDTLKKLSDKNREIQELEDKVGELNGKIATIVDATSKHREESNSRLNKLTQGKQGLESEIERLNREIDWLREQQIDAQQKLDVAPRKLSDKENQTRKLYKEEELQAELDRPQREVERLTKENKNLSRGLREKLKELDDINNLLTNQYVELEEINRYRSNEIKELKSSLLEESRKKEHYKEALSKKKKEEMNLVQEVIEYVVSEVERFVKGSEEIRDDDKKVILQVIQKISYVLEENVALCLPNEASCKEGDLGYNSRCSTPHAMWSISSCMHRT